MSSNHLKYDPCAYEKYLQESKNVGCYQLYAGKYVNRNQCRIDFGVVGGNDVSLYKGNLVDLESEMMGITRANSLCPTNKYMPRCQQPCDSGLPSGPLNCNSELANLPTCQLICYGPRVFAPTASGSMCQGQYKQDKGF